MPDRQTDEQVVGHLGMKSQMTGRRAMTYAVPTYAYAGEFRNGEQRKEAV